MLYINLHRLLSHLYVTYTLLSLLDIISTQKFLIVGEQSAFFLPLFSFFFFNCNFQCFPNFKLTVCLTLLGSIYIQRRAVNQTRPTNTPLLNPLVLKFCDWTKGYSIIN